MMTLLAVDPGQAACGAALFIDGRLARCAWVKHPMRDRTYDSESFVWMAREVASWPGLQIDDFVYELPKVYPGAKGQADPDDLLPLAVIGGVIAGRLGCVSMFVRPREWKGTIPKPIRAADPYQVELRVRARLDAGELAAYEAGTAGMSNSTRHNVADAVGIGLHAIGRGILNDRKRVYSR